MPKRSVHDLNLPDWGPYSKRYAGVSHIADPERGTRFDLTVIPGLHHGKVRVPACWYESAWRPVKALPDLKCYRYRHDLEGKSFADVTYTAVENGSAVTVDFVNNCDRSAAFAVNLCASIEPYSHRCYGRYYKPAIILDAVKPDTGVLVHALDYMHFSYGVYRPLDALSPDGTQPGEYICDGLNRGRGLGYFENINEENHDEVVDLCGNELGCFGEQPDDTVIYELDIPEISNPVFVLRYRHSGERCDLTVNIGGAEKDITLAPAEDMTVAFFGLDALPAGKTVLTITAKGGQAVLFDTVGVIDKSECGKELFVTRNTDPKPELEEVIGGGVILKYRRSENYYVLLADTKYDFIFRKFYSSELDTLLPYLAHEHLARESWGDGEGYFTNINIRPIYAKANETVTVNAAILCAESYDEAKKLLEKGMPEIPKSEFFELKTTKYGERYLHGASLMSAMAMTNTVYPLHIRNDFVKNNACGRWWDSFYTWDSGFTGLGLNTVSRDRAMGQLTAYLTPEEDKYCPFIQHGSLVPTPFYLFKGIMDDGMTEAEMADLYPKLKRYYRFFIGKDGSTMGNMKTGLLRPWDYNPNSGGWDDYPPQLTMHATGGLQTMTPCVTTAHAVRMAKILREAASRLGIDDIGDYTADIEKLEKGLNDYAWDAESGYFSYVIHDEERGYKGKLLYGDLNANMGIDGVSPIVTGDLSAEQFEKAEKMLMTEGRLWTKYGITAVDRTAPYFRTDGYWNGSIWFPHQWFYSMAFLDYGRSENTVKIAQTALDIWERETEISNYCYENYDAQTGRGEGWHHFTALSSPILVWFKTLCTPGTVTGGLDCYVAEKTVNADRTSLSAKLHIDTNGFPSDVIVCMNDSIKNYVFTVNGTESTPRRIADGTYALTIDPDVENAELCVKPE